MIPMAKNDLIGSRRRADRVPGRPPIPPADPRLEAAKDWSTTARSAARDAFSAASSSGANREEAIEAGYRAGLRRQREELELPPVDLVAHATKLFGARVVEVLPPANNPTALEERCFERLFPDQGFPEPASPPATQKRSGDSEDKKTSREENHRQALADELGKRAPTRQGSLFPSAFHDARTA